MKSFLEYHDSADGWSLFLRMLENMQDVSGFLVYADWLEEHGYTECAKYLRSQIDENAPRTYYGAMEKELKQHGMSLADNVLIWKPDQNEPRLLMLTHDAIRIKVKNKWVPISKKTNVAPAAPGLAMILASMLANSKHLNQTHEEKLPLAFLAKYNKQLYEIIEVFDQAMHRGSNVSPIVMRSIPPICTNIEKILNALANTKLSGWEHNVIQTTVHRAETLQDELHATPINSHLEKVRVLALKLLESLGRRN